MQWLMCCIKGSNFCIKQGLRGTAGLWPLYPLRSLVLVIWKWPCVYVHVPARIRIILLKLQVFDGFTKMERVLGERERGRRAAELSRTCVQPDEKLSKGQNTAPSFKGHVLMVTLPQTLGNRPRRSLDSTGVVGDTRKTRPRYDEALILTVSPLTFHQPQ